ncbi:MAG TPA: TonB-dependent receptor plug domain-containing protein, partial [Rhizomicrobium sp.]|nr:TonB-dependent receptor plug domain-containing protein [Rhizomicrobium sp.]
MSVGIRKFRARLAFGAGILALASGAALAQSADFALPSQPLSESLKQVARLTGQNILFMPGAVAGLEAPPLRGQMSSRDAVDFLLKGTNLEAQSDGAGGLIVRPVAARNQNGRTPAEPLPPDNGGQVGASTAPPPDAIAPQSAPRPAVSISPIPVGPSVEQVVVSASRISIGGYEAPTPVTVIGPEQLERDSQFSIGDAVRELPAVGISSSPVNGGGAANIVSAITGVDTVNLRNLGITRTLVLFDGQRVVQSNITGGVDLSTIPATMVQRVDVVTGGASAAWGSDAVAGVVNLVLDKAFSGFKANIEGGDSDRGDLPVWKAEASYGADFDGGRGHVLLSGQYTDSPDVVFSGQRAWYQAQALVNNPAFNGINGQPQYILATHVGLSQATTGGLIVGNAAGTTPGSANVLRGVQFAGPQGTPTAFDFGNISGPLSNGGSAQNAEGELNDLTVAYHTTTLFGYGRYRLTPDIEASVQLNYGQSWTENNSVPAVRPGNLTILAGNPYIPASVAATMAANGIPSLTLGTINTNNITDFSHLTEGELAQSLGVPVNISTRALARGVFTLEGALGEDWSWNSYYQHGAVRVHLHVLNDVVNQNYADAVDAVTVTAVNAGVSGLSPGGIACRSSLSAANGCQPLDVFGDGVASRAAIDYVDTRNDFETMVLNEDVTAGSMQGVLPWSLPAGQISVAFGAEYRKEGGRTTADPGAVARLYSVGNFNNFAGQYSVTEGFAEIDVPLLKDDLVDNLDFNAAGRLTSYSTSGLVETWKLGLTSKVNDDLRLRATWSLDIRAP